MRWLLGAGSLRDGGALRKYCVVKNCDGRAVAEGTVLEGLYCEGLCFESGVSFVIRKLVLY